MDNHAPNPTTASQPEISETVRTFTDPKHTTDMITDHVTYTDHVTTFETTARSKICQRLRQQ